ncbi:hypothetical protein VNO78_34342 [Psophocarpus tetragonolobus]|uniref:Uncharacterized protein n=1 Tax=Psophocarpus tetragonolobus TaxID=3891 RepID=A0AAN9RPC6_PSOTE
MSRSHSSGSGGEGVSHLMLCSSTVALRNTLLPWETRVLKHKSLNHHVNCDPNSAAWPAGYHNFNRYRKDWPSTYQPH